MIKLGTERQRFLFIEHVKSDLLSMFIIYMLYRAYSKYRRRELDYDKLERAVIKISRILTYPSESAYDSLGQLYVIGIISFPKNPRETKVKLENTSLLEELGKIVEKSLATSSIGFMQKILTEIENIVGELGSGE